MYLEEMRSVEDDFALDDSFVMKKDSSTIKQLSTKHLEQLVDTKSNENLSTKLVNSTTTQESQSFKNNIQNIQTEKLQQPEPSLTHGKNVSKHFVLISTYKKTILLLIRKQFRRIETNFKLRQKIETFH